MGLREALTAAPSWVRWFLALITLRILLIPVIPILPEEAYHWNFARHLDWGYYDHPPMIAWAIAAGRLVFGDTQRVVRSGNWHGNDTCWRMVLDLNKCLFAFDGAGKRRVRPLRYLAVVDGIIGGEGSEPLVFLKEISSDGNMQTVDVIFPAYVSN